MRHFQTGDEPTNRNLHRLGHFADQGSYGSTADHLDGMICGVIESMDMLPKSMATRLDRWRFMTAGAHYDWPAEHRAQWWQTAMKALGAELDAVAADPALNRDVPSGPPDCSDRKRTLGEKAADLLDKLEAAGVNTREGAGLLQELGQVARYVMSQDVRELKRPSAMKNVHDMAKWRAEVMRHLIHGQIVVPEFRHPDSR